MCSASALQTPCSKIVPAGLRLPGCPPSCCLMLYSAGSLLGCCKMRLPAPAGPRAQLWRRIAAGTCRLLMPKLARIVQRSIEHRTLF